MKKYMIGLLISLIILVGCKQENESGFKNKSKLEIKRNNKLGEITIKEDSIVEFQCESSKLKFDLNTLELIGSYDTGEPIIISKKKDNSELISFDKDISTAIVRLNDNKLKIIYKVDRNHLKISISGVNDFDFPSGNKSSNRKYIFPRGEGYLIPADDNDWIDFFKQYGEEGFINYLPTLSYLENDTSINIFMEHSFHSKYFLEGKDILSHRIHNKVTPMSIESNFSHTFYFSTGEGSINACAKDFRDYLISHDKIEKKRTDKLAGALHIYMWDEYVIADKDVRSFKNVLNKIIKSDFGKQSLLIIDKEIRNEIAKLSKEKWLGQYGEKILLRYFEQLFLHIDEIIALFDNSEIIATKNEKDKIIYLKKKLAQNFQEGLKQNISTWGKTNSKDFIDNLKKAGFENVIIGLPSYTSIVKYNEVYKYAISQGYMVAPYDSYNSVHHPDDIGWETADFGNAYFTGAIINQNNKKDTGFSGRGSHLNSFVAKDFFLNRIEKFISLLPELNGWFIDTDATGEALYEDYNKNNKMTKTQDMQNRKKRLQYLKDKYDLIVGSEGAYWEFVKNIDYGEGGLTPYIWDYEMMRNKSSKYFVGKYWPSNEPPIHFKPIPLKKSLEVYFLHKYRIPFYSLIYNDSVVITDHWLFDTFKIQGIEKIRMLISILYQDPCLFNISKNRFEEKKEIMKKYYKIWSKTNILLYNSEMISFEYIDNNPSIQKTTFANGYSIIVNFETVNITLIKGDKVLEDIKI